MSKSSQVDALQGRVINLLTNDFSKFHLALLFTHVIWQGPLELVLIAFLVYREVGVSGLVGTLFVLCFVPIYGNHRLSLD
jgi:hypothetical protein